MVIIVDLIEISAHWNKKLRYIQHIKNSDKGNGNILWLSGQTYRIKSKVHRILYIIVESTEVGKKRL